MTQNINWFPGHMKKAKDELLRVVKLVDIVYILLDARAPISSLNDFFLQSIKNKEKILLFNKSDLSDRKTLKTIINQHYRNYHSLIINSNENSTVNKVLKITRELLQPKVDAANKKGIKISKFRAVVVGIPNVGKTTLINNLAKSNLKVENRPGVTTSYSWTRLSNNLELCDSPGIMIPKMNFDIGMKMLIIGAIKDDIAPLHEGVIYLLTFLYKHYSNNLFTRYRLDEAIYQAYNTNRMEQIYNDIAKSFGLLAKGGEIDFERTDMQILVDFRSGKLGCINLDIESIL